jgi:hypothetical protein
MKSIWKKLRKDEYVLNSSIYRMTKKKKMFIEKLDNSVINDKRYA